MIINISATLTEAQALILAKEKGYVENIETIIDSSVTPMVTISEPNPETSFEFLKNVYEAMIIADAQHHYIEYDKRIEAEARQIADEQIKNDVIASISSSVI
jgi:uncharacterized protein YqgV (UPF0045/DUF77 family)